MGIAIVISAFVHMIYFIIIEKFMKNLNQQNN